jgi:uncharacterized protein (DUF885 family)
MKLFQLAAAALIFSALDLAPASAQEADVALNSFFTSYLDRCFQQRPLDATKLGDHRFDGLLDDVSAQARKGWIDSTRATLQVLPLRVDKSKLTRAGQIDYEILEQDLTKSLWLSENVKPFEEDPRVYSEYISDSVFLLLAQSTQPKETNIANAITRMGQIPRIIVAARSNLKNPPRAIVETAIRQNQGAIGFYEKDIFSFTGKTPQQAALKEAALNVAANLKDYQYFLEKELLPRATGEWRLGRDKFYRKMELELNAGITADQVLADAESDFVRVERDMYVIARQLWSHYYPSQPLPPDDQDGRHSTIRQVLAQIGKEHGPAKDLVRDVRAIVKDVKKFIAQRDILRLPEPDTCQVIEMPEFQRGNSTAYMNAPPPLDPKASGYYAVSPPPGDWDAARVNSYLEEYNRHMLHILTIHEAYPGHYVQLAYGNRNPSAIRNVLQSGVYIEGWAVYTEQTMLDQGYGEGNMALRMTQLKFYLRAVANAILDHKMHCTAITDEEALKFLMDGAFQSEGEARLKIIRAKQSSCQLSTYFTGRMAMYRLRQAVEREQGASFNLGGYHEAVLHPGPVPVKYLPELVRSRLAAPR